MSLILAAVVIASGARLPLVVRMYDSTGLAGGVLARAQQSAGATLASAGIEPVWHPCHASGCVSRPRPHEIEIRFVRSTAMSERESLGFAAVDVIERAGTLATVYVDRVDRLAAAAGVDRGELLGRAMAHEIGHLLLGTSEHASHGLMRATWKVSELRRGLPLDWMFSGDQTAELRRRLAARIDGVPAIESVTAQTSDYRSAQ